MTQLINIKTNNGRILHINADQMVYVGHEETGQLVVHMVGGVVFHITGTLDEFLARHPSNRAYTERTPDSALLESRDSLLEKIHVLQDELRDEADAETEDSEETDESEPQTDSE